MMVLIVEVYRDNGKESGNYYVVIGLLLHCNRVYNWIL